jgi:hypothetical protein
MDARVRARYWNGKGESFGFAGGERGVDTPPQRPVPPPPASSHCIHGPFLQQQQQQQGFFERGGRVVFGEVCV